MSAMRSNVLRTDGPIDGKVATVVEVSRTHAAGAADSVPIPDEAQIMDHRGILPMEAIPAATINAAAVAS